MLSRELKKTSNDRQASFAVKVVGKTDYGCIDSAVLKIYINTDVYIPSAFSPNGDGTNDYFRIRSTQTPVLITAFNIYNRWGKLIWSGYGQQANKGWDGTYQGTPAEIGVYYYTYETTTERGQIKSGKGSVTLVR